jgi:N-ethylmaleimide reductase
MPASAFETVSFTPSERSQGQCGRPQGQGPVATQRLRRSFKGRIVAAGGFERDTAEAIFEKGDADAVAFGRHFLANPDLPKRIKLGLPLNDYDRKTFYTFDSHGYMRPFRGRSPGLVYVRSASWCRTE